MKKMLVLFLCIFLFAVAAFSFITADINSERDNVTVIENVLYGDKSVVEGLTVLNKNHYKYQLFWEMEYKFLNAPNYKTEFKFTNTQHYEEIPVFYDGVIVENGVDCGLNVKKSASEQNGISKVMKKLYDNTKPGNTSYKTIRLKDYYEYYPLHLGFDLPNVYFTDDYSEEKGDGKQFDTQFVGKTFRDFFKIPVLKTDTISIEVSKSEDGDGYGTSVDNTKSYNFFTNSAISKGRCFFTISNQKAGEYVDTSLIPGGYGIYAFYFDGGDNKNKTGIFADSLETVFPLEKETEVLELDFNADETKLLLYTYEKDASYLTVIDIKTMKVLNKICLLDESITQDIRKFENFIVVGTENGMVVVDSENDEYKLAFVVDGTQYLKDGPNILWNSSYMDYKNGKLATVGNLFNEETGVTDCGFFVAVYDKSGLLYYAEYENELDINNNREHYRLGCHPYDIHPNTIKWN